MMLEKEADHQLHCLFLMSWARNHAHFSYIVNKHSFAMSDNENVLHRSGDLRTIIHKCTIHMQYILLHEIIADSSGSKEASSRITYS